MFVCTKEVKYPTHSVDKTCSYAKKSQQTLSPPNLKILLSCAHLQATKYYNHSVNDIEIEHLSLCSDNFSYFILFFFNCLCHSSSSLKVRSNINLVD